MTDPRDALQSSIADRYRLDRELGRGGMATVYLAHDLKHQRLVAVKVLNADLGAVLGADRFLSEIRVTANLQHPNLLPLFDSGDAAGQLFYVMPYVDGESLRARLDRETQLPIAEAVRIASAVGSALDYAHRHGVIHRDLKPENILLHDGQPVVADFGIALAVSNAGGQRVTQTGLSLGTPRYMSPEQATGDRQLDARSDIYSLGAVTYEMLTGEPPHSGTSAQAIIAKVLTEKPTPVRATRETVPPHVEHAIERALAKVPADRWQSARELVDALEGRIMVPRAVSRAPSRWQRWLPWATAGLLAAACGALLIRAPAGTLTPNAPQAEFAIASVSDRSRIESSAIAPDGQTIAISARTGDSLAIWIRHLDDVVPRRLQGSDGGTRPFFSPDGRWVGFVGVDGIVRKVPVEGGSPTPLSKNAAPLGIAWVSPDTIMAGMLEFTNVRGLSRLSASGSENGALTAPSTEMHHWPIAAANGRSAVFTAVNEQGLPHIAIISLRSGHYTPLDVAGVSFALPFAYFDGAILYRDATGGVWSVPVDLEGQRTTGPPLRVDASQRLRQATDLRLALNGTLLYTHTEDRVGLIVGAGAPHPDTLPMDRDRFLQIPRWSPDGRSVAILSIGNEPGLYVIDRASHTPMRITTWRSDLAAVWSADGNRLTSTRQETADSVVWWFSRDGRAEPERLVSSPSGWSIVDCAPSLDGRFVAMGVERNGVRRVYVSPAGGGPADARLVVANGRSPRWSHDGAWIAYEAEVGGKSQIFAQRYPSGGVVQLSDVGATHPVWAPNGKAIYYESGRDIVRTDVEATPGGLRVQRRQRVLTGDRTSERGDAPFTNYDVSSAGELAVFGRVATGQAEVVVALNWAAHVRRPR